MMRRAVCPGSFDPVTNGHIDVFLRAAGALRRGHRRRPGQQEEDLDVHASRSASSCCGVELAHVPNIRIDSFHGLLVDYCRDNGIIAIVKGLRAITDFDYELQMAQMNLGLAGIETLFISTNPLYSYLSSSLVKEVATYGGDVSGLIPARVHTALQAKLAAQLIPQECDDPGPGRCRGPPYGRRLHGARRPVRHRRGRPGDADVRQVRRQPQRGARPARRRSRQMLPTAVQEAEELLADRVGRGRGGLPRGRADGRRGQPRGGADARRGHPEAQAIIDQASAQQAHMVSTHEVTQVALAEADAIRGQARGRGRGDAPEVDEYVEDKFAAFEASLTKTLTAVQKRS